LFLPTKVSQIEDFLWPFWHPGDLESIMPFVLGIERLFRNFEYPERSSDKLSGGSNQLTSPRLRNSWVWIDASIIRSQDC
jgi:hypothetical protein